MSRTEWNALPLWRIVEATLDQDQVKEITVFRKGIKRIFLVSEVRA